MTDTTLRLAIMLIIILGCSGLILVARLFVARQRRLALMIEPDGTSDLTAHPGTASVQILAFSSDDCRPCKTLQAPALRYMQEAYGNALSVKTIDPLQAPELAQRYHVLTVPTTIVLDAIGKPHAVNYGYANRQTLSHQVDALLTPGRG